VLTRLRPHLLESTNFNKYQSAYRKGHSTETALLEILDRVYTAADDKQVIVLISLDMSAAFDAVDHEVLLQRLQSKFGVTDVGSVPMLKIVRSLSSLASTSRQPSDSMSAFLERPTLVLCCSQSTAVRRPTSS